MTIRIIAAALLLMLASAPLRAEDPAALPPAVGVNGRVAEQRTALFAALAAAKSDAEAREGWNQLGYVYFLAGDYDASLAAIEHVLALEPLHYAALAGKGIIFFYEGKVEEAQVPLKRALAINPWLKERNLIGKDFVPTP